MTGSLNNNTLIRPYTDKALAIILGEIQLFVLMFPFSDLIAALPQLSALKPLISLLTMALLGLSVIYLLHNKYLNLRLDDHYFLLTFLLLFFVSAIWVHPAMAADANNYTMRTLFTMIQSLVIVQVLNETPRKFLRVLQRIAVIMTVLTAGFIFLFPSESNWVLKDPERHQSFFASPNNLGQFLAFALITINFYNGNKIKLPFIILLNLLLVYSAYKCNSMTSQIGAYLCIAAYFFKFILQPMYYVMIFMGIGIPLYTHFIQGTNVEKIEYVDRDLTFTGRSDVWDIQFNDLKRSRNDLLGFGAGGYWGEVKYHPVATIEQLDWEPHQGHNGYLDIRLMLGIVGLVLLVLFLLNFIQKMFNKSDLLEPVILFIPFIIIINNFTESSLFRARHFYFLLFMLMYWYVTRVKLFPPEEEVIPRKVWKIF